MRPKVPEDRELSGALKFTWLKALKNRCGIEA
jgi:hypothetical protein